MIWLRFFRAREIVKIASSWFIQEKEKVVRIHNVPELERAVRGRDRKESGNWKYQRKLLINYWRTANGESWGFCIFALTRRIKMSKCIAVGGWSWRWRRKAFAFIWRRLCLLHLWSSYYALSLKCFSISMLAYSIYLHQLHWWDGNIKKKIYWKTVGTGKSQSILFDK